MMKTYVITLSRVFQKSHSRAGEPTEFASQFHKTKIHTIRSNYALWRKRFDEIEAGKACLSIRQWLGLPYRSKQIEIAKLTAKDNIGIEKVKLFRFDLKGDIPTYCYDARINGFSLDTELVARNDGFKDCTADFWEWFDPVFDKNKSLATSDEGIEMVIIHFTKFRYNGNNY